MDVKRHGAQGNARRARIALTAVGIVALFLVSACAPLPVSSPASEETRTGPFELTILHSNDTWGYLDPCG